MRPVYFACLAALWTHAAAASAILVSFTPDGSDCDLQVEPLTVFTTYVVAQLGGDPAGAGITGAEFRVDGFDPAWFSSVTPSPLANVALGNPITGGCNIAFPSCQSQAIVLLYTIQSLSLEPVPPLLLRVQPHQTPSSPNFPCVLVTLCNPPLFTKICITGYFASINWPTCPCCPSVERSSWSAIKSLYATASSSRDE